MKKLLTDVSDLTNVSEIILKKLLNVSNFCIGHFVHEAIKEQKDTLGIDIGIGVLFININKQTIRYRFEPSKETEKMILQAVVLGESPIALEVESHLQEKIEKAYKEVL